MIEEKKKERNTILENLDPRGLDEKQMSRVRSQIDIMSMGKEKSVGLGSLRKKGEHLRGIFNQSVAGIINNSRIIKSQNSNNYPPTTEYRPIV